MRLFALFILLTGCAPEAQINVVEPPFLVDSYPGNGSVLPASQASPLLFRFSKPVAQASGAAQHIAVEALDQSGNVANTLPLNTCSSDADGLLLECPINGNLQTGTRYRITLGTGLVFASGEQLLSPHQRWFQTLPE